VTSGAIPLTSNFLASTVIGMGGYAYSYNDGTSTACIDATAFCGSGSTTVTDTMGKLWGAGIGFNLNQAMATGTASPPIQMYMVPATAKGITYGLSALPTQGARLQIDLGGTDYCTPLMAATGTVMWSSFNSKCWDNSGTALAGPPATATHILFQVTAVSAATPFDFCVTKIAFM
jgi:hypothetical protein